MEVFQPLITIFCNKKSPHQTFHFASIHLGEKNCSWENYNFFQISIEKFSEFEQTIFETWPKIFRQGCQKCILRVQRNVLELKTFSQVNTWTRSLRIANHWETKVYILREWFSLPNILRLEIIIFHLWKCSRSDVCRQLLIIKVMDFSWNCRPFENEASLGKSLQFLDWVPVTWISIA